MNACKAKMVQIEMVSADIAGVIKRISDQNIMINDFEQIDELTCSFWVSSGDYKRIRTQLEAWGAEIRILNAQTDLVSNLIGKRRTVLGIGVFLICLISLFLSGRVLFVQVEGNDTVPALQIQEVAASCGIRFGVRGRTIRSEKVKNELLEAIPQLQWAGVNMVGCTAVIRVEEKAAVQEQKEAGETVTSIVASNDGIIDSFTVTSGNGLCYVGQAVKAGQTLISGYTDCGIVIKAQQAKGEVYAKTLHTTTVISPLLWVRRVASGASDVCYSIKIGKNLINFNKGSGISPTGCVKMYEERYLTLPGGFRLPIALVRRTTIRYDTRAEEISPSQNYSEQAAQEYLLSQLVAGQILRSDVEFTTDNGCVILTGQYQCREMIGRTKTEQSVQGDTNCD